MYIFLIYFYFLYVKHSKILNNFIISIRFFVASIINKMHKLINYQNFKYVHKV